MYERGLSEEDIKSVLENPEQVVEGDKGRVVYQSRKDFYGTLFLVRVVVEESTPPLAVTVYMTTRIAKYWRKEEDADQI